MKSPALNHLISRSVACLALVALSVGSGCCLTGPCGPGYAMYDGTVATGCQDCGSCDSGCDQAFPGSCGNCVPGNGGGLSGMMLPLMCTRLACGSGCGGVYWNEWMCNPPECDPCDDCGCYVGPQCGDPCAPGCAGVLARGPFALVYGVWQTATGVVGNVLHLGMYGYPGYGVLRGCDSGCDSGCGTVISSPACDSCGQGTCDGGCAQSTTITAEPLANHVMGSGVQRTSGHQTMTSIAGRPPHRVVSRRLRR